MKAIYARVMDAYDAHATVYRLYWTLLQFGAGAIGAYLTNNPAVFPVVTALAVVISSEARKKLEENA